jgi:hypothetical protein
MTHPLTGLSAATSGALQRHSTRTTATCSSLGKQLQVFTRWDCCEPGSFGSGAFGTSCAPYQSFAKLDQPLSSNLCFVETSLQQCPCAQPLLARRPPTQLNVVPLLRCPPRLPFNPPSIIVCQVAVDG